MDAHERAAEVVCEWLPRYAAGGSTESVLIGLIERHIRAAEQAERERCVEVIVGINLNNRDWMQHTVYRIRHPESDGAK